MHLLDPTGPAIPANHGRIPPLNRLGLDRSAVDEVPRLVEDARCPLPNALSVDPR